MHRGYRKDLVRSPKPTGSPIFCPQQAQINYFALLEMPKIVTWVYGVSFGNVSYS